MTPPPAVRRFAMLWWGSTLIWLAATALAWRRTEYQLAQGQAAALAHVAQPVTVAVVLILTAAIWWPVRRGSGVARWAALLVAVLSALLALGKLIGQLSVGMPAPITTALFMAAAVVDVASITQLFSGGAAGWFTPLDDGAEEEVFD